MPSLVPQTPARKRHRTEDSELPPARRRRSVSPAHKVPQDPQEKDSKQQPKGAKPSKHGPEDKTPGAILLSSPSDVSDMTLLQLRAAQAKKIGMPDLSSDKDPQNEGRGAENKHPPLTFDTILNKRGASRPPLPRRVIGRSRSRLRVGIVRWWSSVATKSGWDGEETETDESDSPPSSPCRGATPAKTVKSKASRVPIDPEGCGCIETGDNSAEAALEDTVGTSVLPIDPSQACFDESYSADQWQLRSPSPDPLFVPIPSSPGGGSEETSTVEFVCAPPQD